LPPIPDYIFFKHKTSIPKNKNKQFYSYRPPLSFSVLSFSFASSSYFEMLRLCSLSYSEFFYSFPCFFVHYSVIYHYFPPATYIDPFSFSVTKYCGQAPSAPLYIREVPGSDQVWVFSEVSPHHHIVVSLISQIRRMLVSINLLVPTTFLSHHPESFLVCSRSTPLIHFLRTIPSVFSHLHFPNSLWIFLSLSPSPLHNFSVEVPSQVYTIYLSCFFFIASSSLYCLSLFSTIYCIYELFFPCILLLLPFLFAFL
jgi:hypothetical protein